VRNHEPVKLVKAQVLLDLPLKATLEKLPEKEFIQPNQNFGKKFGFPKRGNTNGQCSR